MQFRISYQAKDGMPCLHLFRCMCSSALPTNRSLFGSDHHSKDDLVDAPDPEAAILDLYDDQIQTKELTPSQALKLARLGMCIRTHPQLSKLLLPGVGSTHSIVLPAKFRAAEEGTGLAPVIPIAQNSNIDHTPAKPLISAHQNCDHPSTKSARAACRRAQAKKESK